MSPSEYDVIVVGSGVAGLTSGALLAHKGYRTLVVEKLPFIGGRAGTLPYKDYKLPNGTIFMNDEVHGALCREVNAEFNLRPAKGSLTFRINGENVEPPRKGIFRRMIGLCATSEGEATTVYEAFHRAIAWSEPSRAMTLREWLEQYTRNTKIIGFFNFWAAMNTGLRDYELPAGEFFRFFRETSFVKTFGFLPEAGGSFTSALAKAIKRDGGDVWTRSPAVSIEVRDGAAVGVTVRHGNRLEQLSGRAAICNAGPQRTVELAGRQHFDPGTLRQVDAVRPAPQIMVFIESDEPLLEGMDMLCPVESRRTITILDIASACPALVPQGKYLYELAAFLTTSSPPYDFNSEVELALLDARDIIPNFDQRARVLCAHFFHGPWAILNVWAGESLPFQTPIEGLYSVGDGNAPSGWWGSVGAVKSGRLAAEDVMRRYPLS